MVGVLFIIFIGGLLLWLGCGGGTAAGAPDEPAGPSRYPAGGPRLTGAAFLAPEDERESAVDEVFDGLGVNVDPSSSFLSSVSFAAEAALADPSLF